MGLALSGPWNDLGMVQTLRRLLSSALLGALRFAHSGSERKGHELMPGAGAGGDLCFLSWEEQHRPVGWHLGDLPSLLLKASGPASPTVAP